MNESATSELVIFTARRIYTMDDSLPVATAVAVADGRIVAVEDLASMDAWRASPRWSSVRVDTRFASQVLLPGLIDNHIHPFLGAVLMPTEHIAPECWRQADGTVKPSAQTPEEYRDLLVAALVAKDLTDPSGTDWLISFGYQPLLHGDFSREVLDALCPTRPVLLLQRSFHESYFNSAGLAKLGVDVGSEASQLAQHPQVDWERGHFFEMGHSVVMQRLIPYFLRPEWYHQGLAQTVQLMHMGGITTAADMLFGAINPDYELAALDAVLNRGNAPVRVVNVMDARRFSSRASSASGSADVMETPDTPIDFEAGLAAMEALLAKPLPADSRIWNSRAVKLFADGAMFSQLMQMNAPGYIDGHHGEWLMSPSVLAAGVKTFWQAGWQIHVHVNGDGGLDAALAALETAQNQAPKFEHRFGLHHVGFSTSAQAKRMAALGAHASVNPYYVHALADDYAKLGLGPERAAQITRSGSMVRAGMRVSFHSDFMMAPTEPLFLAWIAATRTTQNGNVVAPTECLSLVQALRGITIDAAWALKLDHEIGSIVAGKRADFCVLEDDPFELGASSLKDIRVAGTVFEGSVHMLTKPTASIHVGELTKPAANAQSSGGFLTRLLGLGTSSNARSSGKRYQPLPTNLCCAAGGGYGETCDLGRYWFGMGRLCL